MSITLVQFRQKIEDLRQLAASQRYYIDPKALKNLCTHELVLDVVKECGVPRHSQEERAKTISAIGCVTFSILVYIREESLIVKFLEHDVFNRLDDRLPMNMDGLDSIAPGAPGRLRRFEEHQWQFIPVILQKNLYKNIGNKFILPFMEDVHHGDSDGSFGKIYIVTMEAALQELLPAPPTETSSTVKVIRKQLLFRGDKKSFDKEREVLTLLQKIKHPNIAELLCSYTYNQEHSLLFELEDIDLSKFLKLDHRYKDFKSNTTFFTAFYGLASALETIHNCSLGDDENPFTVVGYHHDIRPQNILVRANDFVLTDFGLAKMSEGDTSSGTPYKAGFGEYAAPECMDEDFVHQQVGRGIDIWSLGAMMVDIASFIEAGAEGKSESVRMRREEGPSPLKSNTRFHAHGRVKIGVKKHIQSLERDAKDRTLRTFLKLSRNMLKSRENRLDASTVRRNASYIAIKSLFRAALAGMVQFRRRSSEKDPDNNWMDLWKLSAWGEVININGVQLVPPKFANAIKDGQKSERTLQKTLLKLVKLLGTEPFCEGPGEMSSPKNSYTPMTDEISKLVSELKRELPTSYQNELNRRKLQMLKERDATEVPNLSDEALQSSPDLEPIPEPSMNPTQSPVEVPTTIHGPSSMTSSGKGAEGRMTTPGAKSDQSQKTPSSSAIASNFNSSTNISTSEFDDPNNHDSDDTTPELADGRMSKKQARSDSHLSHPSEIPELTLPEPSLQRSNSNGAHGASLAGTGIVAELTFAQHKVRRKIRSEVHVRGNQSGQSGNDLIFCDDVDRNVSICHNLTQSTSRYPHTDHPIGDKGTSLTVYFLGEQVLEEQTPPTSLSSTGDVHQPRSSGETESSTTQIRTQIVEYIFASATDRNLFRARVWGKTLVISTGVKNIQGSTSSLGSIKAGSVSLSVWESSGKLSVAFLARVKKEKKHVELELGHSNPVRQQTEGDISLILRIDNQPKNKELRIEFDSEEDCANFKSAIHRQLN